MSLNVPLEGFGGSGGVALNFKVVGNPKPVAPSENTIWVDTDEKITGWVFSAAQPETAKDGIIWFSTGASENTKFDALKKNSLIICPIRARQYTGGTWSDRDAEIYQSGAWKPIIGTKYLFKQGEGVVAPISTGTQDPTLFGVTITNDNIYAYGYAHSDSAVNVSVYTESEIDLNGYTTLCFDIEIPTTWPGGTITFGVSRDPMVANNPANMPFVAKQKVGVCSRQTIRVDISGVEKGYLGACGCGNYYIYNWWYE